MSTTKTPGAMRPVLWVALVTLVLDQVSKYLVVHVMGLDQRLEIAVLPPFLQFRMAWNQGMNFGLMASSHELSRWLLIVLALAISAWVWRWIGRSGQGCKARASAGLLIGGAIGNVIDRLLYGAVADFLNTGLPGFDNPFSFNVADVAIFLGAVGLVLFVRSGEAKA